MRDEIGEILFFAFFIAAGAIIGMLLFPGCWWLSLPVGGVLGFLSAIMISFFVLLAIVCALVFILFLTLTWFSLKNWAEVIKRFIKESKRRIKIALHII